MRTTLTLEDDVAARLQKLVATRDSTLKGVVNEALRRGLDVLEQPSRDPAPYRLMPRALGQPRLGPIESVSELLALAEGDRFR